MKKRSNSRPGVAVRDDGAGGRFRIRKIPKELTCQTNVFLAVMIRDAIRHFRENTRTVGSCVAGEQDGKTLPLCPDLQEDKEVAAELAPLWRVWREKLQKVSDEFDELAGAIDKATNGEILLRDAAAEKEKRLTKQAFRDLAEVFGDLWW